MRIRVTDAGSGNAKSKRLDDPISGIGMSDSSSGFPTWTSRTALIFPSVAIAPSSYFKVSAI